ncbi:hypothetical protein H1230_07595 [Paenibacillus sp. 19GGS1-52]|uniref:hypothetical protein n=1 Tax=Paenibacillus sp. 19GGS1-52 TaxID=2758563 RepID=UPI001EFC01C1|nr:hypothetical protein [Paenibacillus sp. 19GGS1-52]ULO08650.1 hypothetical protein H1230_07595 [Paenibacillus sp. 19GGS1-52]
MELTYRYHKDELQISETLTDTDIEFEIWILAEKHWAGIKAVQRFFEEDKVYTDVLFYAYENHHYRVIVRQDYYVAFILSLLKQHLIEAAEWV